MARTFKIEGQTRGTFVRIVLWCLVCLVWPMAAFTEMPGPQEETPWCVLNPAYFRLARSVRTQLENDKVHVVKASKQADAKKELSETPFKAISRQEAEQCLRKGETLSDSSHLYLVRASSLNIDAEYNLWQPLIVLVFPQDNALRVTDESLSRPGRKPINFAIVVETDAEVHDVNVVCLTAV